MFDAEAVDGGDAGVPDAAFPDADPAGRSGVELLYTPAESIYAAAAPDMVANGWSVFPQELDRRPGRVYNATIKWAEEHDLRNRLPSPEALALWCGHCAALNVACVFGPASGHAFAVDIDVLDEAMSAEIAALADLHLGYSPLRREGRYPKLALIYRHAPGEANRVASTSRFFAAVDAAGNAHASEHGLEIQGEGKLLTFHGRHHKTGTYFKWLDQNPQIVGPEAAPLVTPDQVRTFLEAVDLRFPFHRGASFRGSAVLWEGGGADGMAVPRLVAAGAGAEWQEGPDGKVVNGREKYLTHLVYQTVRGNLAALYAARAQDEAGAAGEGGSSVARFKRSAAQSVIGQFETTAQLDGRWRKDRLRSEVGERVVRFVEKVLSGRISIEASTAAFVAPGTRPPRRRPAAAGGDAAAAAEGIGEGAAAEEGDPELAFLPPNALRSKEHPDGRAGLKGYLEAPEPGQPGRGIDADRKPIAARIGKGLDDAFEAFFADVYGARSGDPADEMPAGRRPRVHILKAPTGAGKTSHAIRFIARDRRTYRDYAYTEDGVARTGRCPVVMLLPTYNNIDELRSRAKVLNLDQDMSDAELRRHAEDAGLIHEGDLPARIEELRRDALKWSAIDPDIDPNAAGKFVTMVYQGKIRARCAVSEKVELAMSAGVGTSAFCKATVRDRQDRDARRKGAPPPPPREVFCPHYGSCDAIRQRAQIADAHVVFLPHSFLSLAIPDELRHVRAVVADERIHHLFLHTATFSATTLALPRKPPRLTKREKDDGVSVEDLLIERELAADIALRALREDGGKCPAAALLAHRGPGDGGPDGTEPGWRWVQSAIKVCSSAIQRDGTLSPEMPIEQVRELCSQPTGRDVREELQFWTIIRERMVALRNDSLRHGGIVELRAMLARLEGGGGEVQREVLERRLARALSQKDAACGARDHRIQHLVEESPRGGAEELIRISWRGVPNWEGVPVLLLDASAAPEIIEKIWRLPPNAIQVHDIVEDIGMALNVKIVGVVNQTFSNASVIAAADAPRHVRIQAARNLANVRDALSAVAGLYGDGRVVAGTSIAMRKVINNGWICPDNVDWCHYGAMRGLDMFKHHGAAFSVGRMEVPVRTVDGLVAALTYDDEVPEPPFDVHGNGRDAEGNGLRLPMGDQRLRLRSGHTAVLPVPMFPGRWGRLIQRQYREEELCQFVGRLRPVYREGRTPVWFALSSVIPEELVVDELIAIDDLLRCGARLWDAARIAGGVVEPNVLARACPDYFRRALPQGEEDGADGEEAAALRALGAMERLGFDRAGARVAGRAARGHIAARWRPAGGGPQDWRTAFVRASVPDPAGRLRDALRTFLRVEAEVAMLGEAPASPARPRPWDKVEEAIGSPEERAAKAERRLSEIGEMLLDSDVRVESGLSERAFETPDGRGGSRLLSIAEVGALAAIDDHWAAAGAPFLLPGGGAAAAAGQPAGGAARKDGPPREDSGSQSLLAAA